MSRSNTLHNRLIERACTQGWKRPPWKGVVRQKLHEEPWACEADWEGDDSEIWSMIAEVGCVPDAWRLQVEGTELSWLYPVLILEFLEVEVTNHVNDDKLINYDTLWWRLDATEMFHLRVFRMDKYGIINPLITENTTFNVLGYLYGPDGRRAPEHKSNIGPRSEYPDGYTRYRRKRQG